MEIFKRSKTLYLGHTSDEEAKEMIKNNIIPLVIYNPNMENIPCEDYICLNRGTDQVRLAKNIAVFEPTKPNKVKFVDKNNEVIKVVSSYYENGVAAYLLSNNYDFTLQDAIAEEIVNLAKVEIEKYLNPTKKLGNNEDEQKNDPTKVLVKNAR